MISLGAYTLAPITPIWVVGTYDHEGKPNVMTAAWAGICCSKPPCIYVSLRKATYTYRNIMKRKAFTISFPSETYVKEADYFGIASGRNEDKFSQAKLTPVKSKLVDAPYVKEFPMVFECRVVKTVKIGLHTEFIGEILDVKANRSVLDENKMPDVEKVKPLVWSLTNMSYRGVGGHLGSSFSIGKKLRRRKKQVEPKKSMSKLESPFKIRPARPRDQKTIRALLSGFKLPLDGLKKTKMWVLELSNGAVIGVAGLEVYSNQGLLRSVAVREESRRKGYGTVLAKHVIDHARKRRLQDLFLLTTTAAPFFEKFGFKKETRENVIGGVANSAEFIIACPKTATIMRLPMS